MLGDCENTDFCTSTGRPARAGPGSHAHRSLVDIGWKLAGPAGFSGDDAVVHELLKIAGSSGAVWLVAGK